MKAFSLSFALLQLLSTGILHAQEDICRNLKDHPAFIDDYRACLRTQIAIEAAKAGVDCEHCLSQQKNGTSDLVQALSVIAQPLGYVAAKAISARYEYKTQAKWAETYASGFEQCTNRFNSYLNYNTTIGANPITASEAQVLNSTCNGSGYGSYAGYGGLYNNGFGSFSNPYLDQGYSAGYLGVYGGPYALGSQSVYGNGMMAGGMGVSGYAGFNFGASANIGLTPTTSGVSTGFGF